jgi:predicted alpha/beta hydrolase family esterase
MNNYFIVPGLGNSGPQHWQTWFEQSGHNFHRIQQKEWNEPVCADWISNIDSALAGEDLSKVILIGHSLGCASIAHWAKKYGRIIKAAMLVAPSDVESLKYDFPVTGFSPMPTDKINFKTIVVASSDDQWVTAERAAYFASNWNSELISIGNAGHINAASGHYEWKEGLDILKSLD